MNNTSYAVIGVSNDTHKYGHKVFMYLNEQGYHVTPIHPDNGTVAGVTRYRALSDMPHVPDVVVTVVPPAITEQIARECAALKVPHLWMQPGSESDEAIAFCKDKGIHVTTQMCIMLHKVPKKCK